MNKFSIFSRPALILSLFLGAMLFGNAEPSAAADPALRVCKKTRGGAITLRTKCAKGETQLRNYSQFTGNVGAQGPTGAAGSIGAPGADGSLRIYGDGSDGAVVVSASTTIVDPNLQYSDLTINSGVTLTVPSGTIFRCSGTFINNGTISVQRYAAGALRGLIRPYPDGRSASQGTDGVIAQHGEIGDDFSNPSRAGGTGQGGLAEFAARTRLRVGPLGGGGGAGGLFGGDGAGTITVLAKAGLIVNGTISATGSNGSLGGGGGGGGIVILATPGTLTVGGSATISVRGGNGGSSGTSSGNGGGGGAGFIHYFAPAINDTGTEVLTGGTGVVAAFAAVTLSPRTGGGAGGSCYGAGGSGGSVDSSDNSGASTAGGVGALLTTLRDPTSFF